ncbi:MAG TPA: hypothetical protein EYQ86_04225, partial [Bacteroidetes bacterium]|nr:hypothetical protein [Bacteroidota bacterium]
METATSGTSMDIKIINDMIHKESAFVDVLNLEISKKIIGQKYMIERLLIGLLGQGHVLLEGVPGLAKTLAINTLSQAISADYSRIQFTPDLLPADIIGTMIYNMQKNEFTVKKGPIFANFIIADETTVWPAGFDPEVAWASGAVIQTTEELAPHENAGISKEGLAMMRDYIRDRNPPERLRR